LAEWNDRYNLGANTNAREIKRYFNSLKYQFTHKKGSSHV
jgi:hypothetical protein